MASDRKTNRWGATKAWASVAVLLAMGVLSGVAAAQDKKQVREQAKNWEARYRAVGEPMDRCSLSASLGGGSILVRTMPASVFRPGDKLMELNGAPTANKSTDDIVAILRKIPADATIPAIVERSGKQMTLSVTCINARQTVEPTMTAISFAARGKFDECVDTLSRVAYVDSSVAILRSQCAAVSRNPAKYNASGLLAQAMESLIQDASYSPTLRAEVVKNLRNAEGIITQGQGAARYRAMVQATERWPGGETAFATSGPDWALFRRNAEATLRTRLIDPDSARIQWTHGFLLGTWKPFLSKTIEGYWTCGLVNARNRMGGYTGSTSFVVVMDPSGYVKYSEIGESKEYDLLSANCGKSAKLLPPPPAELSVAATSASSNRGVSIADELRKLVEMHDSGALTDAEFQAAKQRLLGSGSR